MKNFARQYIKYQYSKEAGWDCTGNIGDCIQNIAVEELYKKAGISPDKLININRDSLPTYNGPQVRLVMQGWFADAHECFPFPWSDKIDPVFLGFHVNKMNNTRERFVRDNVLRQMKAYEPIGCRDRNTRDFLKMFGLDAYFSGCMTLTFDTRKKTPRNGKIFIVDLQPKSLERLPDKIREKGDFSITHLYKFDKYPITEKAAKKFEDDARNILKRYKEEAKMVITSRIHVAMPCIAMGIPVVFICDHPSDERFDVLRGIIPVYRYRDVKYVNWKPGKVNINKLKNAIINNAIAQIKQEKVYWPRKKLEKITSELKPIRYLPWYKTLFKKQ